MISFLIVLFVIFVVGGTIAGIVALASLNTYRRILRDLERRTTDLVARVSRLESLRTEEPATGARAEYTEREVAREVEERPVVVEPRPDVRPEPILVDVPEPSAAEPEFVRPVKKTVPPAGVPPEPPEGDQGPPWWAGLEESVGKRWMTWGGVLALFLSAGFFLKYAFENQWLGPTGRVALGILAGLTVLVSGDQCVRREMRALGQGLMGGALAILYISLFAAFSLYDIVPQIPAFGAMVLVTAAGMALAVLHNAVPLGFLAVLGGFLTPLMVSTGQDARDSLFAYLTILNLGVLGVAVFKRWRALDVLAFVATWLLFGGWFFKFYRDAAVIPALAWVTVFYAIFLLVPFIYQLRKGTPSSIENFVMAVGNAVVTFGFAYQILHEHYQHVLGFVALAMAACYVSLAAVVRRRLQDDARTLFGFVALSVVLLTLAVPLHLKLHGIVLAWAVEGPVLLYLGYVFRYRPVRIAGFAVLVLATMRLFAAHWPFHANMYVIFFNRHFAAAMFVPLAAAVYAIVHHRCRSHATELDLYLKTASAMWAGFLALVIVSGEVRWWFEFQASELVENWRYLYYSFGAAIWALGAALFLVGALRAESTVTFYAGLGALVVAMGFSLVAYAPDRHQNYLLFLNIRFAGGLLTALAALAFAFVAKGWGDLFQKPNRNLLGVLFGAAGVFPLLLLSFEVYTYCHEMISSRRRARWTAQMALSALWGMYAVGALVVGFWRRVRVLRVAALGLLAVVAAKVLLVDMARVQQIYRIVSFVVVGLMMISASYLYHRLERRLVETSGGGS